MALTAKSRKQPNRRRVYVRSGFARIPYKPPTEQDWLFLQTKLGKPLTKEVRNELVAATKDFAALSRPPTATASLAKIALETEQWRKRTVRLQNIIWPEGLTAISQSKAGEDLVTILNEYFSSDISDFEHRYPLALLHRFLSGITAICRRVELIMSDKDYLHSRDRHLWFLWATHVFSILAAANIPLRHPRRKKLLPGPVLLLEKLQATLPKTLQARHGASLRKAAIDAFKLSRSNRTTIKHMRLLLETWGKGDLFFGSLPDRTGDLGLNGFIARLEENVEIATTTKSKRIR
jgi:hypothetical protein